MKTEKVGKIVSNLHDEKDYVIHKKFFKQALCHRLVLKKCTQSLDSTKKLVKTIH